MMRTRTRGLIHMALRALALALIAAAASAQTSDGWRQADGSYNLELPRDHASHPDYKVEWWYYTGNLAARDGHRYGFQVTFFRVGIDREPKNPSRWAIRDIYMTHLAVTDVDAKSYVFRERVNRAGVGWAGAAADTYRVWNEDWIAELDPDTGNHRLEAIDGDVGIALELEALKPLVKHGENGLSRKGPETGNASEYYSMTRMRTTGRIVVGGTPVEVTGLSWMDHEFGTTFLEREQKGWDWFAIQLDDGADLMLYQFRRADGSRDEHSSGTLVGADGGSSFIRSGEFVLEPLRRWRSPHSGAEYPVAWRVVDASRGLDLTVSALVDDQELMTGNTTGVTYWEGAVEISGTRDGRPVSGRGYLEMTGYTDQSMGAVFE